MLRGISDFQAWIAMAIRSRKFGAWGKAGEQRELPGGFRGWITAFLVIAAAHPHADARGQVVDPWLTGDALERAVDAPISTVSWRDTTVADGFQRLARAQRVRIWLDRRVDPQRAATAEINDAPLLQAVRRLAQAAHPEWDAALVPPVIYVGPAATVRVLATVSELRAGEVAKLDAAMRKPLSASTTARWERLAEPADLLQSLAAECGLSWSQTPTPHDLWNAGELPPCPRHRQLSLLLAGFGATYAIEGARLSVQSLPASAVLQQSYPLRRGLRIADLKAKLPEGRVAISGDRLWIEGPWESQRFVRNYLAGRTAPRPKPSSAAATKIASLRARGSAESLLKGLAGKLKFEVAFAPDCGPKLQKQVDLVVMDVTRAEAVQRILDQVDLQGAWDGDRLQVRTR